MELTQKEWNNLLDTYLITGEIEIKLWLRVNEQQQYVLSEIKKSLNRIKNK